jgi:hypothetical protein
LKELATLVDESATASPVIDQVTFGASAAQRYWSSTPELAALSPGYAYALETDLGITAQWEMTNVASARCVRQAN